MFAAGIIIGCVGSRSDINADKYQTDYSVGLELVTKVDLFLMRDGFLLPAKFSGNVPLSSKHLDQLGASNWPGLIGLVPTGTLLVVKAVELEKSRAVGNRVCVTATIVDSTLKGASGDLAFISKVNDQQSPPASVPQINTLFVGRK